MEYKDIAMTGLGEGSGWITVISHATDMFVIYNIYVYRTSSLSNLFFTLIEI